MKVPDWAGASDLSVDIRRSRLSIAVLPRNSPDHPCSDGTSPTPTPTPAIKGKDESGVVAPAAAASLDEEKSSVLAGGLARPVQVDECLWTTERRGSVVLYLQKELPAEGEPGFEWWTSVMEGDPEIDTLTCDAGSVASEYPEHARRRGAKAVWDDQRKSPEEKLKEVGRFCRSCVWEQGVSVLGGRGGVRVILRGSIRSPERFRELPR